MENEKGSDFPENGKWKMASRKSTYNEQTKKKLPDFGIVC